MIFDRVVKTAVTLGCLLWLGSCTAVPPNSEAEQTLTVFAAASLTDAFTELGQAFAAQNEAVSVRFNFAGSSQLVAQLREGARADIFASANEEQMQTAVSAERIQPESIQIFATNRLALIVPVGNPANVERLADLARPGVRLVLTVPGVPVRAYSDALVADMPVPFQEGFYANVVSEGQNVRQVVAQIALGEADAGIVYQSDISSVVARSVLTVPLPEADELRVSYPVATVADAPQPVLAERFIQFVRSTEGQEILAKWGFGPAPGQ